MIDYKKLLPKRPENSHKGTFGKLLVIAGSKGMSGAAYLNGMAAYLSGAGMVKIYTHEDNRIILQTLVPEAIMSTYNCFDENQLKQELEWSDLVLIGSGLGKSDISEQLLCYVMNYYNKSMVLDADAINLLSKHLDLLNRDQDIVFTPHLMELSRLTNKSIDEIKKNPDLIGNQFVNNSNFTLIMKDSSTKIFKDHEKVFINPSGNCAMAKAGSGDVLAGIIAGFLAQSKDSYSASILGTYIHGLSGDLARKEIGVYSVLARDLLQFISKSLLTLDTNSKMRVKSNE